MDKDRRGVKREATPINKERSQKEKKIDEVVVEENKFRELSDQKYVVAPQPHMMHQQMCPQLVPTLPVAYGNTADHYIDPNQANYNMCPPYNMYQWCPTIPPPSNALGATVCPGIENPQYAYMSVADQSGYCVPPPNDANYPHEMVSENGIPFQFIPMERKVINGMALSPPRPSDAPPTRNEKPNGCKTVYVGGLPDGTTEQQIRDIFGQYAEIETVRMSEKNFCHIRFKDTMYTEIVLQLSGFRLKLDSNDPRDGSRLHVDYAFARNDQHEYNCNERMKERERRHRMQAEIEDNAPPPVPHYSESEMQNIIENLKKEETFKQAMHYMTTWLEKGECTKSSASNFYTLIQSINSLAKRMKEEKEEHEHQVEKAKDNLMEKCRKIALQLDDIVKVMEMSFRQRNWDHFSKTQRKNIEKWKTEVSLQRKALSDELIAKRNEEEMELEDEDSSSTISDTHNEEPHSDLKEREKAHEQLLKEFEINSAMLSKLRLEYNEMKKSYENKVTEVQILKATLEDMTQKQIADNLRIAAEKESQIEAPHQEPVINSSNQAAPGSVTISEQESLLITLVSTFLNVHPFGASIDYICSYLVKMVPSVSTRDVEALLKRFPAVFKEESTGIGACLEKKWLYLGFRS